MAKSHVSCTICSESFDSDKQKKNCVTPCGHIYHHDCLTRWLQELIYSNGTNSCPNCRSYVSLNFLQPVYLNFTEESKESGDAPTTDVNQIGDIEPFSTTLQLKDQILTLLRIENKLLKSQVKEMTNKFDMVNLQYEPVFKALMDHLQSNRVSTSSMEAVNSIGEGIDMALSQIRDMEISILKIELMLSDTEVKMLRNQ